MIRQYSRRFFVRVEQISIQGDHIYRLVRAPRRSKFHHFFRVTAGQIAQRLELKGLLNPAASTTKLRRTKQGLWLYRPFSRVVRGWRGYRTIRDYIQLNEMEALGKIPYRKERLRGLSSADWELLWSYLR